MSGLQRHILSQLLHQELRVSQPSQSAARPSQGVWSVGQDRQEDQHHRHRPQPGTGADTSQDEGPGKRRLLHKVGVLIVLFFTINDTVTVINNRNSLCLSMYIFIEKDKTVNYWAMNGREKFCVSISYCCATCWLV